MIDDSEVLFIIRGKRRKIVLFALKDDMKTPRKISQELKLSISNVSTSLAELKEKGFVDCKNPKDPYHKIYFITKKGQEVVKELPKYDEML
jgi:DNA-binding MarR family transcriptional regulator